MTILKKKIETNIFFFFLQSVKLKLQKKMISNLKINEEYHKKYYITLCEKKESKWKLARKYLIYYFLSDYFFYGFSDFVFEMFI